MDLLGDQTVLLFQDFSRPQLLTPNRTKHRVNFDRSVKERKNL